MLDKKLPSKINKFTEAGFYNTSIATNVALLNEKKSRELFLFWKNITIFLNVSYPMNKMNIGKLKI